MWIQVLGPVSVGQSYLPNLYPCSNVLAGKEHSTHFGYRIVSHRLRIVEPTIHLVT